jgi:hypothetical protein
LTFRKSSFDTDDQGSIDARDDHEIRHKDSNGYEDQISYTGYDVTKLSNTTNPFLNMEDGGIEDVEVRKISNDSSFSMETASAAIDKAFSSIDNVGEITVGVDVVKQNPIFDSDFDRDTSSPIEEVNVKDNLSDSSDEEREDEFVSIKAVEPPVQDVDTSVSETEFMSLKVTADATKDNDESFSDTEYISMKANESSEMLEAPKDLDTSVSDTEYCVEGKLEIKLDDKVDQQKEEVDGYNYEASAVDDDEAAYNNIAEKKVSFDNEYVYNVTEESCAVKPQAKDNSSDSSSESETEEGEPAEVVGTLSFSTSDDAMATIVATRKQSNASSVEETREDEDHLLGMAPRADVNNASIDVSNNNVEPFTRSRSSSSSSSKSSSSKTSSTEEHQEVDYATLEGQDSSSHVDTEEVNDEIHFVAQEKPADLATNGDIIENIVGAASAEANELVLEDVCDEVEQMTNHITATTTEVEEPTSFNHSPNYFAAQIAKEMEKGDSEDEKEEGEEEMPNEPFQNNDTAELMSDVQQTTEMHVDNLQFEKEEVQEDMFESKQIMDPVEGAIVPQEEAADELDRGAVVKDLDNSDSEQEVEY